MAKDYEAFMKAVGFQTKLCKPRHPFTKGKVERLVRFVKENFLVDRTFQNISDLNWAALNWCNTQNAVFHRALGFVPQEIHFKDCAAVLRELSIDSAIRGYLCPERRLSFDGFVSYEGIRFGVPSDYLLPTVRITRDQNSIRIFSYDFHGSWFHIPSRGVDRTKSVQGSLRKYLSQKSFRQLG